MESDETVEVGQLCPWDENHSANGTRLLLDVMTDKPFCPACEYEVEHNC